MASVDYWLARVVFNPRLHFDGVRRVFEPGVIAGDFALLEDGCIVEPLELHSSEDECSRAADVARRIEAGDYRVLLVAHV